MSLASNALKTARAEGCMREILWVASCGQISLATAGVLINGVHADRTSLLTDLRRIKAKATEAEVLLRSIDAREELAS
jgi:hypothetical protein